MFDMFSLLDYCTAINPTFGLSEPFVSISIFTCPSESWAVNAHTMWYTRPVSVASQGKPVSDWVL